MDVSGINLFSLLIYTHELYPLYEAQRSKLLEDKIKLILQLEYSLNTLQGPPADPEIFRKLYNLEQLNKKRLREKTADAHNNRYFFITINPPPNTDLLKFIKKVEKYSTRILCVQSQWVFEQRGVDISSAGTGVHCHMLVERNLNYKPCKFKDYTRNAFKCLFRQNNHLNNSLLNIKPCCMNFLKDKIEYMTGDKTGDGKQEKQDIDIIWRENNNLLSFYGTFSQKT